MKKAFIAQIGTETNTFSPLPTGLPSFQDNGLIYKDASLTAPDGAGSYTLCYRELAEAGGYTVVESLSAGAQPAGPTVRTVYEHLRDTMLADLKAALPVDMVLMSMHGAMMADGYDDCEGDMIARMRAVTGPNTVIGVELDPHCHLTEQMVTDADAIVIYKEYPHTDFEPRAKEMFDICAAAVDKRVKPVSAVFDCRMVGFYPTTAEPMAGFVRRMVATEREPGILSVSLAHGFPWGDNPETGTKVLVIADSDADLAARTAERLAREFYRLRHDLLPKMPGIDAALDDAGKRDGLVVLADVADNCGGGAPGDTIGLLQAMLARQLTDCAFGTIYDPIAVRICEEAGVGARVQLRLGGKLGESSGGFIDVTAEVKGLKTDHQQSMFGKMRPIGASAWVRIGGVDVVLASLRTQVFAPEAFTGLGIALDDKRIVVVKSSEHFRAGFASIARHIIPVATPGALQLDFANMAYRKKRDMGFFPRVDDPLS